MNDNESFVPPPATLVILTPQLSGRQRMHEYENPGIPIPSRRSFLHSGILEFLRVPPTVERRCANVGGPHCVDNVGGQEQPWAVGCAKQQRERS